MGLIVARQRLVEEHETATGLSRFDSESCGAVGKRATVMKDVLCDC